MYEFGFYLSFIIKGKKLDGYAVFVFINSGMIYE